MKSGQRTWTTVAGLIAGLGGVLLPELKAARTCPGCQRWVSHDARSCPNCGRDLIKRTEGGSDGCQGS